MITELGLKNAELVIYAVIWGFTQDGRNWFNGSSSYLADWANISRQQAMNILPRLVEKGLLLRKEQYNNGQKFVLYKAIVPNKSHTTPPQAPTTCFNEKDDEVIAQAPKNDYGASKQPSSAKKSSVDDVINAIKSTKMKKAVKDWVEHRVKKKKPLDAKQLLLALEQLKVIADTDDDRIFIINQTIIGDYVTFKKLPAKDLPSSKETKAQDARFINVPDTKEKMAEYRQPKETIFVDADLRQKRIELMRLRARNEISGDDYDKQYAELKACF